MQALILTGGMGTRLRPLTLSMPKPLLPVVNRPFLSYPIALARKHGVRDVVLCTAGSKKPYRELIRREKLVGSYLDCSMEKKELGTAGAIKNAEKLISDFPIFVFNGDVLTDINLSAMLWFHRRKCAELTVALVKVSDPSAYGLVSLDSEGKIKEFSEKPSLTLSSPAGRGRMREGKKTYWINAGIYILEKEVVQLIPKGRKCSIEREIFPLCLKKGVAIYGFKPHSSPFWLELGTPEKYLSAQMLILKNGWNRFGLKGKPKKIGEASIIGKGALLGRDVVVGKRCRIGKHSHLRKTVLLDNVVVEDFVEIENCILGSDSKIGHHSNIKGMAVIGNNSHLTPFTQVLGFTPTPIGKRPHG